MFSVFLYLSVVTIAHAVEEEGANQSQRVGLEEQFTLTDIIAEERFTPDFGEAIYNEDWFSEQQLNLNFGSWGLTSDLGVWSIADALRVSVLVGDKVGTNTEYLFPDGAQDITISYCMRLGENWDSRINGKFPGFAGDSGGRNGGQGGSPANGDNAWSARMLFGEYDEQTQSVPLGFYVYHTDQSYVSRFGDTEWWAPLPGKLYSEAARITKNRWYGIKQRIRMNSAWEKNGILEAWVDNERVYSRTDLNFTNNDTFRQVERFWLNVYVGGAKAAESDQTVYFADFVHSTQPDEMQTDCSFLRFGSEFVPD